MRVPEYNPESFAQSLASHARVLVQFGTDWCAPCKRQERVLLEAMKCWDTELRFGKLNVEDWPECAASHGVRRNPTLCLFQSGAQVALHEGFLTLGDLEDFVGHPH